MRAPTAMLWVVLLVSVSAPEAGAEPSTPVAQARPHVDTLAMREAIDAARSSVDRTSSSASYAHFLQARLLHFTGQHRSAIDELRLAQVTDDRSEYLGLAIAEEYARVGEMRLAERELKRIIERQPNSWKAQLLMGRVLLESKRFTRAKVHLRKATRLWPSDPEAWLVLGQLYLETKQPNEAVRTIEEFAQAAPEDSTGYRRLGLAFAERGDLKRAEPLLVKATQRQAVDLDVLVTLARIYEATQRIDSAEKMFALALELDPENSEVLLSAGRLALRQAAPDRARAYLDRLLSQSDSAENVVRVAFAYLAAKQLELAAETLDAARGELKEPRLAFYAGLVYEKQRRWDKAAAAYEGVGTESELAAEAEDRRALALSLSGQHARALELYKKARLGRPEDEELIVLFARALERSGANRDAEQSLSAAARSRNSSRLTDALADHYARHARFDEAVALLHKALEQKPTDKALHYSLGALYERKGELDKSLASMRKVLELDPDDAAALNFIGYTLADQGIHFDEAERMISRALEQRPDNGAFLDSLGWVHYRRGDFQKAVEILERAAEHAPGEPVIAEHLGDAYRSLARTDEARRAYLHALELVRTSPDGEGEKGQKKGLERKLKLLSSEASGR